MRFNDRRVDSAVRDWFQPLTNHNLLILSGPQTGKTTAAAWMLGKLVNQGVRVGVASYSNAQAKNIADRVEREHGRRPKWHGGVGASSTVGIFDALIIDDPVRSEADALSDAYLERQWRWWLEAGRVRLAPGGRACVLMTQWRGEDFAGQIQRDDLDHWNVVGSMAHQLLGTVE